MNSPSGLVSRWIARPAPKIAPKVRLLCFHHAGGMADLFYPWVHLLDPSIELAVIKLPGRGSRFAEPPITSMEPLIQELAAAIEPFLQSAFALFGHSMGALIAFEFVRRLERRGLYPERLFLSGCPAPQRESRSINKSSMNDEQIIALLSDLNGTPPDVLADRDLLEIVLPVLRADFELVGTYSFKPGPRLRTPLSLLFGRRDSETLPIDFKLWCDLTEGRCDCRHFEGDHFFLKTTPQAVTDWIAAVLFSPAVGTARRRSDA